MIEERKDEIQELYDKTNDLSNKANWLFCLNILISFILIFDFEYRDVFVIISLLLTIGYVVLLNLNEIYFSNLAENERRKSLLKESFGINTTLKETNKYYNNDEKPSIEKLGLNCYESAFFTKRVVDKMIPFNVLKVTIFCIIYIVLMININNLDLLLVITQTLFSAEVIFYFIKLCYYKFQLNKICNDFQNIFLILGTSNENTKILLLDKTLDYECLKSYCKILTSSKIFFENNSIWSKEWQKVLKKIKKREKENEK